MLLAKGSGFRVQRFRVESTGSIGLLVPGGLNQNSFFEMANSILPLYELMLESFKKLVGCQSFL
jgi:hypothetical protein